MKKILAAVLLLSMTVLALFAFSACGNPQEESSSTLDEELIGFENSNNASKDQNNLGQWADPQ